MAPHNRERPARKALCSCPAPRQKLRAACHVHLRARSPRRVAMRQPEHEPRLGGGTIAKDKPPVAPVLSARATLCALPGGPCAEVGGFSTPWALRGGSTSPPCGGWTLRLASDATAATAGLRRWATRKRRATWGRAHIVAHCPHVAVRGPGVDAAAVCLCAGARHPILDDVVGASDCTWTPTKTAPSNMSRISSSTGHRESASVAPRGIHLLRQVAHAVHLRKTRSIALHTAASPRRGRDPVNRRRRRRRADQTRHARYCGTPPQRGPSSSAALGARLYTPARSVDAAPEGHRPLGTPRKLMRTSASRAVAR